MSVVGSRGRISPSLEMCEPERCDAEVFTDRTWAEGYFYLKECAQCNCCMMFKSCSQRCKTTKKLHKIVVTAKGKGEALEASNGLMGRCPRTSDPTGCK